MDQESIKSSLLACRDLAAAACDCDDVGNLAGAIRNYDDAIIVIDEVLTRIPSSCDAWQLLMIYREKYSSRMVCTISLLSLFNILLDIRKRYGLLF